MELFITSLNSGSNGNCYYIGTEQEAVLIDAGISCRETEKRMKRLGLSMHRVKAIFISHEHSDHICGVSVLASKYQLPVYITPQTLAHSGLAYSKFRSIPFQGYEPIRIGELSITAFPKLHDASDPHSFIITYQDLTVGVFTDIGLACKQVIHYFSQCHAAFLEANYDETMLEQGRYPYFLKRRIRGGQGHLSNHQALNLFSSHKPAFMSHLLLSHLSKENNCPKLVKELFTSCAVDTEVIIASRFQETPVYTISHSRSTLSKSTFTETKQLQLNF